MNTCRNRGARTRQWPYPGRLGNVDGIDTARTGESKEEGEEVVEGQEEEDGESLSINADHGSSHAPPPRTISSSTYILFFLFNSTTQFKGPYLPTLIEQGDASSLCCLSMDDSIILETPFECTEIYLHNKPFAMRPNSQSSLQTNSQPCPFSSVASLSGSLRRGMLPRHTP